MVENVSERLLEQARAGDEDAFTALIELFDAHMRRFIQHLIGIHPNEDDIVQNTTFALYRNLQRLDGETLRPFIFRVIRNQCYDQLRNQGRYETIGLDRVTLPDHARSPEQETVAEMNYQSIQIAIQQLPEAQRQTMILYAEEGMSYQEIADATSVSIGTVKSRLHHAKKTLRRLLK
ncbi:MAG: RNA polymerase sigma factor [Chloroflexi bacterium]|nr:RNA polymerase sigma factor [Chloroflexota bacterium]